MNTPGKPIILGLLVVFTAAVGVGCAARCKEVRHNYQEAVDSPLQARTTGGTDQADAPHLGVAISADRVDQILDTVIRESIRGASTFVNSIDLGGKQPVKVDTAPDIADLTVAPAADECDTCYRITAELDGTAGVSIPVLGKRSAALDGSVEFVAPVILRSVGEGDERVANVMLDLPAVASHGGFGLDIGLGQLPASWASSLSSPLVDLVRKRLSKELKPVKLAEFSAPTVSAAGLKFTATSLRPVGDGRAFFVGVRSNLQNAPTLTADSMIDALEGGGSLETDNGADSDEKTSTTSARDIAVALPVSLVTHAVVHGFQTGNISRSYDSDGRADPRSPIKVTMSRVGIDTAGTTTDRSAVDLTMGFQLWNIPENGACFALDGRAATRLAVSDNSIDVSIRDVAFSGNAATRLGMRMQGWKSAEFLEAGATVLSTSLSTDSFRIGPADVDVGGLTLQTRRDTIIVGADVPVNKPEAEKTTQASHPLTL